MTEGFETIEILIKFMKRYINLLNQFPLTRVGNCLKDLEKEYGKLSKVVDDLGFVMEKLFF